MDLTTEEAELLERFKEIAQRKWIKGINNNNNSAGLTFEKLLNKEEDYDFFPDYKGIEIKTSQRYSTLPVKLFSLNFDGPNLFETNDLLQRFGIVDYKFPLFKRLYAKLIVNHKELVYNKYYFTLKISKLFKRVYLEVRDLNNKLLIEPPYLEFSKIRSRVELKLNKLAMIYASRKLIEKNKYFRYYKIELCSLKSFDDFIKLLANGTINIQIMCNGASNGKYQTNRGLCFYIDRNDLNKLYNIKLTYNHDEKKYN